MLEYEDFYDIAVYANENWKGNYTEKEIAINAYIYYADFQWSKENDYEYSSIKTLIDNLCEDARNLKKDSEDYLNIAYWLRQMADELELIDMDYQDYIDTDKWLEEFLKR